MKNGWPVFLSMHEFRITPVSAPLAAAQRDKITAFWESENAQVTNPEKRLEEVAYCAHTEDGKLIALCSYHLGHGIYNELPLYFMRVFVAKDYRQTLLAFNLLAHLAESLADKAKGNLIARGVGVAAILETDIVKNRGTIECCRTFQFPINKRPLTFVLTGYTSTGSPEYCHFFERGANSSKPHNSGEKDSSDSLNHSALRRVSTGQNPSIDASIASFLAKERQLELKSVQAYLQEKIIYVRHQDEVIVTLGLLAPKLLPEINAIFFGLNLVAASQEDHRINSGASNFIDDIFADMNARHSGKLEEAVGIYNLHSGKTSLPLINSRTGFHFQGLDNEGRELRLRYFDGAKLTI